jgi:hypothetical protein
MHVKDIRENHEDNEDDINKKQTSTLKNKAPQE